MHHLTEHIYIGENGKLFEKDDSHSKQSHPYMDVPAISIFQKIAFKPSKQDAEFSFRLNHTPCPIWKALLYPHLTSPIGIHGDKISLNCLPADLPERYQKVTGSIHQTNIAYSKERRRLTALIRDLQKSPLVQIPQEVQFKEVHGAFDKLKL